MTLEEQKLWKVFAEKSNDQQREMVRSLVKRACNLLELVRDTFPTYTIHNQVHSINLVKLMGDILHNKINNITALEGAILILSAYYHDIGMVFTEQQKENIINEPLFNKFKEKHPEIFIQTFEKNIMSDHTAEFYCRYTHPDRVYNFLDDKIKWGVTCLKKALGDVCKSHGYDIEELYNGNIFDTEFLGQADLKFCAILLRLADIMDFDNTRSPEEIYNYLGLKKHKDQRKKQSDVQWRKHLCSDGFNFHKYHCGENDLFFIAQPDHPAIEYDVRAFLDTIESEFVKCSIMLKSCSQKWQDLRLPSRIDRKDIRSNGYKYGEYRFTLEQKQILDLLMGENLYDNPYIFVRELLQNAIDTARFRKFYENSQNNSDYKPKILVSSWYDNESYQWIRIDDNGMGMNEHIIKNYLLKVGKSYYTSQQFQADKLKYRKSKQNDFTPISRFGIGILSCFIAGDRLEVSTNDGKINNAIHLSLSGLHSFYVLQSQNEHHNKPNEMPSEYENEKDYRKDQGTSIAVRISPKKEKAKFDIHELLNEYVLCSPVPVIFEDEIIGGDPKIIVNKPWLDENIEVFLTKEEIDQIEKVLDYKFLDPIKVKIIPLDLTKHSINSDLKGQMVVCYLDISEQDKKNLQRYDVIKKEIEIVLDKKDELKIEVRYLWDYDKYKESSKKFDQNPKQKNNENISIKLKRINRRIQSLKNILTVMNLSYDEDHYLMQNNFRLIHNGIKVPLRGRDSFFPFLGQFKLKKLTDNGCELGIICLYDSLRPDFSLSRDILKGLSWDIYSAANLAFLNAIKNNNEPKLSFESNDIFSEVIRKNNLSFKNIYQNIEPEWYNMEIIETEEGILSINEIIKRLSQNEEHVIEIKNILDIYEIMHGDTELSFLDIIASVLIQTRLNLKLIYSEDSEDIKYIVTNPERPIIHKNISLFPPLFFVHYEGSNILRKDDHPLNRNHPFCKWLLDKADLIDGKYPGIFEYINGEISEEYSYEDEWWISIKNDINEVLDRLRKLDKEIRPSKDIDLKDSDYER